jgi:hypothetical protein
MSVPFDAQTRDLSCCSRHSVELSLNNRSPILVRPSPGMTLQMIGFAQSLY